MNDNLLPIGSVVLLHGGQKKVMVTGFCVAEADKNSLVYDYAGCIYPEGVISSDQTCMFNPKILIKFIIWVILMKKKSSLKIN